MRTLGVDLSASPKKTAACAIEWSGGGVEVERPVLGLEDRPLLDLVQRADWVGIDAPFGWPSEFIAAITMWTEQGSWPITGRESRENLRFRATDRFVQATARLPLSVSSDRIAVTAMRCASLLSQLSELRGSGRIDLSGRDRLVEVYPGAALPQWSDEAADLRLDPTGYKGSGAEAAAKREALVDSLTRAAPWLELDADTRADCVASDDALDALLASLIARSAALELTLPPAEELRGYAKYEGWIHLPEKGSLARLA